MKSDDLRHGFRLSAKADVLFTLVTARNACEALVEKQLDKSLTMMLEEPVLIDAVRSHMKVSDRVDPSRRDAFNYLKHCYRVGIDNGVDEAIWDCVLNVWPTTNVIYVQPVIGGAVQKTKMILEVIQGAKPFCVPGRTKEQTDYRQKRWDELMKSVQKPAVLEVCTLDSFDEIAGRVV